MMDKFKKWMAWVGVAPLIVLGYSQIASFVYFVDWLEFARSVVNEENAEMVKELIKNVNEIMVKIDAMWSFYEQQMGVEQ